MPRVGDVFQLLSGTLAVPNTTIQSAPYNAQQNDWVLEANAPRPISAGGTGSTTASGARASLGTMGAGDLAASPTKALVVNTDSVVIIDSEAANVTKRWLVSDIRVAFGPASHDHTKLVNTTADISLNLTGTPGAGVFNFNNKADGTGANNAHITEAGAMALGTSLSVGTSLTVGTSIVAGTAIQGSGVVAVQGNSGNVHFWLYGPSNADRGVIYTDAGSAQPLHIRNAAGYDYVFNNSGQFSAPGAIFAGGSYLNTDGNLSGAIWNNWGSTSAYHAIDARIEARAGAWANDRIANLQYRKVSEGYDATTVNLRAPSGAVITGYSRQAGTSGQVHGLYYMYLQVYDPVRGWVGFSG